MARASRGVRSSALGYVFSGVVGTARCAVRAPFEGCNVYVTGTCGAIGSARSDAGEDIAARCPYPLNRYKPGANKMYCPPTLI